MSNREISLLISCSNRSTRINKTGSWRYMRPVFVGKTAPCSTACPAGEDVARIEKLVHRGHYKRALEALLMENPFPSVCGRVCFHPCENQCNRKEFDDAIAIHGIERFLGDEAIHRRLMPAVFRQPENGKSIAVIGSGPSGMAAAYFLNLLGYACDVFEGEPEPGGILRWGIPSHRLSVSVLAAEIRRIEKMGVNLHCNKPVSKEDLEKIKTTYDGIFMGCGHGRNLRMNIPGEAHAMNGLDFLRDIKKGNPPAIDGPVAVIGGGNSTVDVARTLTRKGISTTIIYRRRQVDMPAFQPEISAALKEGVKLTELLVPFRIDKNGDDYALTLQKMKPSGEKINGRMRIVPETGQTVSMKVSHIITAIGADVAEPWHLPSSDDAEMVSLSHCLAVTRRTPIAYGGDLTNTNKSVADAIASGKQAAMALDILIHQKEKNLSSELEKYLVGNGPALSMEMYVGGERKARSSHVVTYEDINTDYFCHQARIISVNEGDDPAAVQVREEAGRCFNCGNCNDCDNCWLYCPEVAVIKDENRPRYIDTDYCKGCGICVTECPRSAMIFIEETE